MFTIYNGQPSREVVVSGEFVDAPEDVPVRYTSKIIRPDHITGTFVYDYRHQSWRIALRGLRVSGYRRLASGKLSDISRHHTGVSADKGPWAEWSDTILARLNSAPIARLSDPVTVNVPRV